MGNLYDITSEGSRYDVDNRYDAAKSL